ncbi:MAG: beta strand repeat-containing protein, partial [Planctomycetia bacterium]
MNFSAGGGLTVEAGVTTNQIFDPLARGTSGTSTFTNNGSGTLTFGPTSWFNELGGQTWTPAFDGSGDITVTNGIRNRNSSSNISVIKNGSGTLTILSGVNTAPTSTGLGWYTGSTTINAGVLQLGNQWALGGGSGDIRFGGGTLRYSGSNTVDYSARIKSSSAAISIDTAGQTVTFGTSLPSTNTGGLTKLGAGTLTLSASNAYTGATSVNAGTLAFDRVSALNSSSGVNVAAGAILDYTGGAGTLSRNVTVSSSGTGTIRNSGGQALTLSGTLTKDGRVLRLTGGTFNVTGQIVGASANSDLLVDGTSTVTLSSANTYNGPTFVNQASTLIVGVNDAIPSSSTVTLGNATSTGSLDLGTFTNQIGGLVFSGSGGTVRMAANQTASPQLSTSSALTLGSNASLDLAGMQTSAGNYR